MADEVTMKFDPLTQAIRDYFSAKLGGNVVLQSVGLNFDPLAISVPLSDLLKEDGTLDRQKATEFFSRHIADHPAVCVNGLHYTSHESLSELIRFDIVERAMIFPRPDLSEALIEQNQQQFEAHLKNARDTIELHTLVANTALPIKYVASSAVPENWLDPTADYLWASYEQKFIDKAHDAGTVDTNAVRLEDVRLPWRQFAPKDLEEILKIIPPRRLLPPVLPPTTPHRPPLWDPPKWAEDLGNVDVVHAINIHAGGGGLHVPMGILEGKNTPSARALGVSFSEAVVEPVGALDEVNAANGVEDFRTILKRFVKPKANVESLMKLDDIEPSGTFDQRKWDSSNAFKSAVLANASTAAPTEKKDSVEVSFQYQIVQISREWLSAPFLRANNWYIEGLVRGELTLGSEANKPGILGSIPQSFIVIKDLQIRTAFSDEDAKAINEAFALGPFRVGRDAALQEGTLRVPGMQIIAYLDEAFLPLPPRSDPQFVL